MRVRLRDGIRLASLLWMACAVSADAADRRTLNVFLFAGQSNMAGADSVIAEPPGFQSTAADRAARFTATALAEPRNAEAYTPWGAIRGHRLSARGKLVHGPEVGFARRLHEAGWRNVAIIKVYANFARGVGRWPWRLDEPLGRAWTKFVDDRLAELTAQGHRYRVRGFVWHQGIDDAIHGKLATDYQRNLTELIGALRKRYADEKTPFVLARSVNSPFARKESMALVRRAQVATADAVPFTGWIDVDDLPNVNRHHFAAGAQLTIGRRFGEQFLKLAAGPN